MLQGVDEARQQRHQVAGLGEVLELVDLAHAGGDEKAQGGVQCHPP
jgi:hypothetical protein